MAPEPAPERGQIEIFDDAGWQMSFGDRAALEGVLSQRRPRLSIEIGTAEGGSLARIAHHSDEVHALDLTGTLLRELPDNATFHEGDSKVVLPELLADLERQERQVDFALVDGDHSLEGVRADLDALLASAVVSRAVILAHDSFNPFVRAGIGAAVGAAPEKVADLDLDFVCGRMTRASSFAEQLWGGFALLVLDPRASLPRIRVALDDEGDQPLEFYDAYETMDRGTRLLADGFGPPPAASGRSWRQPFAR